MSASMCLALVLAGGHGPAPGFAPPPVIGAPATGVVTGFAPAGVTTFYSPPVIGWTAAYPMTVIDHTAAFGPTVSGVTTYRVPLAEPTVTYRFPAPVVEEIVEYRPRVVYEETRRVRRPVRERVVERVVVYAPREGVRRDDWHRGPEWYVERYGHARMQGGRYETRRGAYRGSGSPAAAVVTMTGTRFEPYRVTVRAGETVEWRNTSDGTHTVTADPDRAANPDHVLVPRGAGLFHSGSLLPDESFRFTFTVPGTYRYVCLPHEDAGMIGSVLVGEAVRRLSPVRMYSSGSVSSSAAP
jgi:plastocyanin